MSHNTTIVQYVQNQNVFIGEVNSAGEAVGMGPVAPGTSIEKAAQTYLTSLQSKLVTAFQASFNEALPPLNQDSGYMGPIANLDPGSPPQCVVSQVNQDLSDWGLPLTTDLATRLASAITLHVATSGGTTASTGGMLQVSSNETIGWMAYFGTFSIEQDQQGVVYTFGAALC